MALTPFDALREEDLDDAAKLFAKEGWTFTPKELSRLLATAPGVSPVLRRDGEVVAVLTVTRHGSLAWIGNVAVVPALRGKGLGEALVAEALRRIDAAGALTTGLCSVSKALSLYERLGFRHMATMRTFAKMHERPTHRPREADLLMDDFDNLAAFDRAAFGADRRALLAMLLRDHPDTGVAIREDGELQGYAFLKVGTEGSEVGPVVAARPDPVLLGQLLDAALGFRLEGDAAAVECTTWAEHPAMPALLEDRGFAEQGRSTLMYRGAPIQQDLLRLAAMGGLEKG